MPELPEVEFATRVLARALRGTTVLRVVAEGSRIVKPKASALQALVGRRVRTVQRKGKWIRVGFEEGPLLFSHLGMTGRWVVRKEDDAPERFERARFDVGVRASKTTTRSVRYLDARTFGALLVSEEDVRGWRELGPDPVHDTLEPAALHDVLASRRRAIKDVLMDQRVIAGLGNIYVTEALFGAHIDPRARASSLTLADVKALVRAIAGALQRSIARHEREPTGEVVYVSDGRKKNPFTIYGRGGEACPRCGKTLVKIVLGGRGTTFCPHCQSRGAVGKA